MRITERQLRAIVRESIARTLREQEALNEGKLGRALGAAALGAGLMFGGYNNANAGNTNYNGQKNGIQQDTTIAQNKTNQQSIAEQLSKQIKENVSKDDVMESIEAEYELIFKVVVDAETMYKNLMTKLYSQRNVNTNETDGMYRVSIKEQDTVYSIFIKDGGFKIRAYLSSKTAYSYWGYDENNVLSNGIISLPKMKMAMWGAVMVSGSNNEFDFE